MTALEARSVSYATPGGAVLVDDVTLTAPYGHLLALLGPNGAGKSTLLGLLSGDLTPSRGSVDLDGRPLRAWRAPDLARRRAVLTQANAMAFSFRVHEVVEMGRHPWAATSTDEDDARHVDDALAAMDVAHLRDRVFPSLSGGEKARVSLARVLAQDTPVVMLDEPTAALDLRHQEDVMTTARALADAGRAVVVVVHDLALAAAHADSIAVMSRARLVAHGSPMEVVTPELVEDVYGIAVHVVEGPEGAPLVVPKRGRG